jgi:HD-GYP domain-containing protein (c-di-GMP phosphodiesterase class II)
MTSDRPYRKALGRDIALGELKKGAGTQFDPKVVETFMRLELTEWSRDTNGGH